MNTATGGFAARQRYRWAKTLTKSGRLASAHRQLAAAASAGHVAAQYDLALAYLRGFGCPRIGSEALRWLECAANAGHREAQFELGVAFLTDRDPAWCTGASAQWAAESSERKSGAADLVFPNGTSIEKDVERAICWLRHAAEAGKPEAQANLGWMLIKGIGCESDRVTARHWLSLAAEQDVSQAALGMAEFFGDPTKPEFDETFKRQWLKRAADLGNASAAYQLGCSHLMDNNDRNLLIAERYFKISAAKRHPEACFEYGRLLLTRAISESEAEKAAEYLRISAKAGIVSSAKLLGELYSRGEKLKTDLREAAQWFRRAADLGDSFAQFRLGCLYASGEGVPYDLSHAARYFELSAKGGHLIAALNIGIFYESGDGVQRDLRAAIHWLTIAANGGVSRAQVKLAHHLATGKHGIVDHVAAIKLLEQAISQNDADGEYALARILAEKKDQQHLVRVNNLLVSAVSKGHVPSAEFVLSGTIEPKLPTETTLVALQVIEQAVSAGSTRGMVALARELLKGVNILPDALRAENLLMDAADQGDAAAHFELGVLYCTRNREPDDIRRGLDRYIQAAELGHPVGQYNAAAMLLQGDRAAPNYEQAKRFLAEAAAQGLAKAQSILAQMNSSSERASKM